jgi:hypothetical protein
MTYTLFGRWQVRILLLATVGLILSAIVAIKSGTYSGGEALMAVVYLGIFGLVWDLGYHQLQRLRWDGDWGTLLQLLGAVWEAMFLIFAAKYIGLPGIDKARFNAIGFIGFDALLCFVSYLAQHSILKILSPYSRFQGGQWF